MSKRFLQKWGALLLVVIFAIGVLGGCATSANTAATTQETKSAAETQAADTAKTSVADEEYVWISCMSSLPMFVDNDQKGLKQFAEDYGVKVSIAGPTEADTTACAQAIETVIAKKPAGIMIIGWDESLKNAVNKAVDSGIPTVLVDGDLDDTKRPCFIGTNWYEVGKAHAQQIVKYTGGKGKVAIEMIVAGQNMQYALSGYKEVIAKYPDMQLVDVLDTKGEVERATQLTSAILAANPDLAGLSNFDGSAPGVGPAIKEANKVGKIAITGMNVDNPQIKLLEEGVFNALVGQKRALFTYYAGTVLYAMNHAKVNVSKNDKGAGITNIPKTIDTGLFIVDKDNVKAFKGE